MNTPKQLDAAARRIEDGKLRKTVNPHAAPVKIPARPLVSFAERQKLEKAAMDWCRKKRIKPTPFNIITALSDLGLILGRVKNNHAKKNQSSNP